MKKIGVILSVIIMVIIVIFGTTYKQINKDYLRIHIRANSNAEVDQLVKYKIKDAVVQVLTPYIANCENFDEVKDVLGKNLDVIDLTANKILKQNGFNYTAKSKLCEEEFPTRTYNGYTLQAGFYDAIIVELGKAEGDNWWCVVYPPLCFTSTENGTNVVYKSRILNMIENFKSRRQKS